MKKVFILFVLMVSLLVACDTSGKIASTSAGPMAPPPPAEDPSIPQKRVATEQDRNPVPVSTAGKKQLPMKGRIPFEAIPGKPDTL